MSISNRTFGVEIEFFNAPHPEVVVWHLNQLGLKALNDYGEEASWENEEISLNKWTIKEDYSLPKHRKTYSMEIASPILRGNKGLRDVRKVCQMLQSFGVKTNNSCGLHVHVSNKRLTPEVLNTMLQRYAMWEDEIDLFIHRSRRENRNRYCRSVKRTSHRLAAYKFAVRNVGSNDCYYDLNDFAYDANSGHAEKLDFDAQLNHGTTEFRHHHGTFDPQEVTSWIKFCLNFVETSQELTPKGRRKAKRVRDTGPLMGLHSNVRSHFREQAKKLR